MKILFTIFDISQIGGILGNTEDLIKGLQEIGHTVDLVQLLWSNSSTGKRNSGKYEYIDGALYPINPYTGWLFPSDRRIPYKGEHNIAKWKKFASTYDVIFWQTPVPGLSKENYGNMDWLKLYDLDGVRNIAIAHDAWFQKRAPHLALVSKYFYGVSAVHSAGYNNIKIDIPKVMILNPFNVPEEIEFPAYSQRKKGFMACHYWKKIKRMDDVVRAIPYIDKDILKIVAGYGIEWNYMTAEEKCKYWTEDGRRLYDVAVEHGMKYAGLISPITRDKYYRKVRTAIDPSWHIEFAKYGEVLNRSDFEAILQGTVSIATNLGVAANAEGNGTVWKANVNYVMIPYDSTPQQFAEIVNHANNLSPQEGIRIQEAALDILPLVDRRVIAQQYVDFAKGIGGGFYGKREVGNISQDVYDNAEKIMDRYFRRTSGFLSVGDDNE